MPRIHEASPAAAVEAAFGRILRERMADVPILNPALAVAAVDFGRWQGHWFGIAVTPWSMSALLVPGRAEGWESVADNKRRFVRFPAGDFAFLGGEETELGEFQSCALFSPMDRFADQQSAVTTARAARMAMLTDPAAAAAAAESAREADAPSPARRRFLALG